MSQHHGGDGGDRHESTQKVKGRAATELGAEEMALLREVAKENVSWHDRSIRLWVDERAYSLVTQAGERLVRLGLVSKESAAGARFAMHGPVELTPAGRAMLVRRGGSEADSSAPVDGHDRL